MSCLVLVDVFSGSWRLGREGSRWSGLCEFPVCFLFVGMVVECLQASRRAHFSSDVCRASFNFAVEIPNLQHPFRSQCRSGVRACCSSLFVEKSRLFFLEERDWRIFVVCTRKVPAPDLDRREDESGSIIVQAKCCAFVALKDVFVLLLSSHSTCAHVVWSSGHVPEHTPGLLVSWITHV